MIKVNETTAEKIIDVINQLTQNALLSNPIMIKLYN